MSKLIIYFSRADENYFGGGFRYIDKGNTEVVAEKLASLTGSDMFKVEPKVPYAKDYNTCIAQAKQDKQADLRPEVKTMPDNIENYDTIFVLYPNYWNTMPMHMFTVLEKLDLKNKVICPLCTNEGSGMGVSEKDLKKCCPGADIRKGLSIIGSSVNGCDSALQKWVKEIAD